MHKILIKTTLFLLASFGLHSQGAPDIYKYLLEGTTWIVPPSTLLAYEFSNGSYTPVTDQTVWIINAYSQGYFSGTAYAYISPSTYSKRAMLGTITNTGAVYISFYPESGSIINPGDLVNGIGSFTKDQGVYQFTMQMNSGTSTNGTSHWSYMISIDQNSPYYYNLPGVGTSLPEFLTNF